MRVVCFCDLFLIELSTGQVRRLTDSPGVNEVSPSFDREGRRVFFRRDNNVFALDIVQGGAQQLTDIRPGPAPEEPKPAEGQRAFVEREELALLRAVRDRKWRDSVDKAERDARDAGRPKPFYLAQGEQVAGLDPSPAGNAVLVRLLTPPKDSRGAQVPNYVTVSGYTEELPSRTKVGDLQGRQRVGVLTVATGAVRWIRSIAGDTSGGNAGLSFAGWNDAGTRALLFAWSRDYTARHLVRVDADSARAMSLDVLRDTAWAGGAVGGPCDGCGGWLPGEQGAWLVSEADGWAHLYTMNAEGGDRRQRTRGKWEVESAELTAERTAWLLHTSEVSAFDRHAYLLPLSVLPSFRLTTEEGGHAVTLSPDGRQLADVFSTIFKKAETKDALDKSKQDKTKAKDESDAAR